MVALYTTKKKQQCVVGWWPKSAATYISRHPANKQKTENQPSWQRWYSLNCPCFLMRKCCLWYVISFWKTVNTRHMSSKLSKTDAGLHWITSCMTPANYTMRKNAVVQTSSIQIMFQSKVSHTGYCRSEVWEVNWRQLSAEQTSCRRDVMWGQTQAQRDHNNPDSVLDRWDGKKKKKNREII